MSTSKNGPSGTPPDCDQSIAFETHTYRITTSISVREAPFPNMEGPTYLIEYLGKDGGITRREIIIQWINQGKTAVWITAYCKLRKEVRKFNSENIILMRDAASGQIIADPTKHLRRLDRQGF